MIDGGLCVKESGLMAVDSWESAFGRDYFNDPPNATVKLHLCGPSGHVGPPSPGSGTGRGGVQAGRGQSDRHHRGQQGVLSLLIFLISMYLIFFIFMSFLLLIILLFPISIILLFSIFVLFIKTTHHDLNVSNHYDLDVSDHRYLDDSNHHDLDVSNHHDIGVSNHHQFFSKISFIPSSTNTIPHNLFTTPQSTPSNPPHLHYHRRRQLRRYVARSGCLGSQRIWRVSHSRAGSLTTCHTASSRQQ